ncbi:hypothetical protein A3A05_01905 [Candidatus Nomurabacteria bacterium RIFCSPLOWO2_01_FULL_41_12]|uniref:Bifunctional protein FolD n=1 Tax=Candidatus Nomurabacteria bacterium RIFCSPLOWO2_01_FULL_41_12 TaxID=1801774 RepID=A0A1F6WX11_9BACT|nr:MAG: hypothetical protein A3A05_01905 [Candidatus Nomurabacteria bacterium RIFCSPLOWO2_01_FULL_41_12]
MQIIDGKKLSREILDKVKSEVSLLPFTPVFCDVLVGEDPASVQYVKMKAKTAEMVGMKFHNASFPSAITIVDLIKEIKVLNKVKNMCGIIVQLPLPEHIDRQLVLDSIDSNLDVDCLGMAASAKFYNNENVVGFPTALACMAILDSLELNFKNKKVVVLGQGLLVGKPVSALLRFRGLEPVVITSKTENKDMLIKAADIIISGIGKGKYITGSMIKTGTILIDAGTSESNGGPPSGQGRASIVGDVDLESVKDVALYVSPVPGGVGPVTVAMLLNNVLQVAKNLRP